MGFSGKGARELWMGCSGFKSCLQHLGAADSSPVSTNICPPAAVSVGVISRKQGGVYHQYPGSRAGFPASSGGKRSHRSTRCSQEIFSQSEVFLASLLPSAHLPSSDSDRNPAVLSSHRSYFLSRGTNVPRSQLAASPESNKSHSFPCLQVM